MTSIAILAGMLTGIVLGLFGSGGSIVTVPALMYLLHIEPKSSIAMGLGIVATTATISSVDNWRRGNVNLKTAAFFALFGVVGTYGGTRLGVHAPVIFQLGLFALVMYAASIRMLQSRPAVMASAPLI
ncbi:MAG: sulfite exporter TauE/SafE family protein, partial [Sulfuricellaceae bacterium]|nr:sulfite exporter TauE/SafE family protein [Sulfuricellaceae bacterium]